MKKFFVVVALGLFVLSIMSSCRSRQGHCPAYGQATEVKTEKAS